MVVGSPWGAGSFSGADNSRQPSSLELQLAAHQGKHFYTAIKKPLSAAGKKKRPLSAFAKSLFTRKSSSE